MNDSPCPEAAQHLAEDTLDRGTSLGSGVRLHDPNTNSATYELGDFGLSVSRFAHLPNPDNSDTWRRVPERMK